MGINITDFKFKKINKILEFDDIKEPVEIYNIDGELWDKIKIDLLTQLQKGELNGIDDREMLLAYLPQLTNLEFNVEDESIIMGILKNPTRSLRIICKEIGRLLDPVIKDVQETYIKLIKDLNEVTKDMSEEEVQKYVEKINEKNIDNNEAYEINKEYDKVYNGLKGINNTSIFKQTDIYKKANNVK